MGVVAGYFVHGLGHQSGFLADHKDHGHVSDSHMAEMGESDTETMTMTGMEMDEMAMEMNPDPVEVAADAPVPQVEIVSAKRDMMGAYSVQIQTTNFAFTPDRVDDEPVANEGHAHVYVNNVKVGREYAEWIYVPASFFSETGPNRITVTLNANTHGEWTYLDSPIQDTRVVE